MKKKHNFRFKWPKNLEIAMIIAIAMCQIALIGLSNTTISQISDITHYGFMSSQYANDEEVLKNLKDWNLDFRPNACKMISMYIPDRETGNLELKMRFYFMRTPDKDLVNVNLEFRNYVLTHDQGYVDVETDGGVEHVFFRWVDDPHGTGDLTLVVVRVNQPTYFYVWIYPIVSCVNVMLIFILVIVIMLRRRQDGIDRYMMMTNDRRFT